MRRPALIRMIIVYVVYTLLICCFQVSFSQVMTFKGQVADLMLIYTVVVSYFYGFLDGAIVGISVGLLRDFFAAPAVTITGGKIVPSVGIGILVMFLASAIASSFFTKRMRRNSLFSLVAVAVVTLLYKVSGHIIIGIWTRAVMHKGYNLTFAQIIFESILPQILLNIVCAIPVILLLRYLGPYRKGINPRFNSESELENNLWLKI